MMRVRQIIRLALVFGVPAGCTPASATLPGNKPIAVLCRQVE